MNETNLDLKQRIESLASEYEATASLIEDGDRLYVNTNSWKYASALRHKPWYDKKLSIYINGELYSVY